MMTSMTRRLAIASLLMALSVSSATAKEGVKLTEQNWSIALHGGAGTMTRAAMVPEKEAEYRKALSIALEAGSKVLRSGGSSLDAVQAVITVLENDPHFNAGRGAVLTYDGASLMRRSWMARPAPPGRSPA